MSLFTRVSVYLTLNDGGSTYEREREKERERGERERENEREREWREREWERERDRERKRDGKLIFCRWQCQYVAIPPLN
jgi:hypothetical protein